MSFILLSPRECFNSKQVTKIVPVDTTNPQGPCIILFVGGDKLQTAWSVQEVYRKIVGPEE